MSGSISDSSSTGSSPVQEIVDNGNVRRDESEDLYSTARETLPAVGEHENFDNENVRRDESEDLYSTARISFSDRQEGIPVEAEHEESQDLFQSGQDLSAAWDTMNIENSPTQYPCGSSTDSDLGANISCLSDSQYFFSTSPISFSDTQEVIPVDLAESQDISFSDTQERIPVVADLPTSPDLFTTDPSSIPVQADGATAPHGGYTLEQHDYTQELSEGSVSNTEDEKISARNLFASSFHESNIRKLKNCHAKPDELCWNTAEFRYVVYCSQMIEKYLGQMFPDDPKKRNDKRNEIEIIRDTTFGIYCNKSEEPQPGPSGYKRPHSESSTSPPKKVKKKESDESDDASD